MPENVMSPREEESDPIGDREHYRPLKTAIEAIASVCDGARKRDEVGFNGADASLGRLLAFLPLDLWPPEAFHEAWSMLRTYSNRQLVFHEIVYADLPVPPCLDQYQEHGSRYITRREDGAFLVLFPAQAKLESAFKRIPGGEKYTTPARHYLVPNQPGNGKALLAFAKRYGFRFAPDIEAQARRIDYQITQEESGAFGVYFPRDEVLNAEIKAIPGRRYSSQPRFHWLIPPTRESVQGLLRFLAEHPDFQVPQAVEAQLQVISATSHATPRLASRW